MVETKKVVRGGPEDVSRDMRLQEASEGLEAQIPRRIISPIRRDNTHKHTNTHARTHAHTHTHTHTQTHTAEDILSHIRRGKRGGRTRPLSELSQDRKRGQKPQPLLDRKGYCLLLGAAL